MEWSDEAIVLSVRMHGETSAIAELFSRQHGRHLGLVRGGRSRRLRPVLQIGNQVDVVWKARLAEQLGAMTLELRTPYAARLLELAHGLAALTSMAELTRLLPERDPHPSLYEVTLFVLSYLTDEQVWPALMVRWELALLDELGVGLDLSECAATGTSDGLVYVSPKSGRAVSAAAGAPWKDRLLRLPGFLLGRAALAPPAGDIADGFALTGHFLETRVLAPLGGKLPLSRGRIIAALAD